jgi:hypothetical protein
MLRAHEPAMQVDTSILGFKQADGSLLTATGGDGATLRIVRRAVCVGVVLLLPPQQERPGRDPRPVKIWSAARLR